MLIVLLLPLPLLAHQAQEYPHCVLNSTRAGPSQLKVDVTEFGIAMHGACDEGDCTWTRRFPAPTLGVCSAVCYQIDHCLQWSYHKGEGLCELSSGSAANMTGAGGWTAGSFDCYPPHVFNRPSWEEVVKGCWDVEFRLMEVCCSLNQGYAGHSPCWEDRPGEPVRSFARCCLGQLEGVVGRAGERMTWHDTELAFHLNPLYGPPRPFAGEGEQRGAYGYRPLPS
jgi:hypothetical protein